MNTDNFDFNRVWGKSDGTSLLQHLEDCLTVYGDLVKALPSLPGIAGSEDFFDWLFCAVYLHDWGKTHQEFQKVLRKDKKSQWANNRHEFFSVPFAEMLPFSDEEKCIISHAIVGHHKDYEKLQEYYYSDKDVEEQGLNSSSDVNPLDFRQNVKQKLDVAYLKALKNRFQEIYARYAPGSRQFTFTAVDFSGQEHPVKRFVKPYLADSPKPFGEAYWQQMLLSGALKICDHMGSGGIREIPGFSTGNFGFLSQVGFNWHKHQEKCGQTVGNLFLNAPTGSGKTEAALLWLRKQFQEGHQGRIFYILPYTASINAMHRRLVKDFEPDTASPGQARYIGILHGKLSQYLSEYYENSDDDALERQEKIQKLKDQHRQVVHPLKIVTPFQILKYFFGVKGFEKGLAELAGAMLIFDEIHAYDMRTFAQISASLEFMRKYLSVRVMIMTATLPRFMLDELRRAVGDSEIIRADNRLLEEFTRHRVEISEGNIFDQLPSVQDKLKKGKRVIVVCNTVNNAQKMYGALKEENGVLLHSRFTVEDRLSKEKKLFEDEKNVKLLVGTQAIEVSLNIDFDIMFTEPAPLDALIQRFGRINRRRKKGICPVYVCREGGENDRHIYPTEIVKKTLEVLEGVGQIKEKELQHMLDKVYPDWPDKSEYDEIRSGFLDSLARLLPNMRHKESEDEFYKQFTGVSVMPAVFEDEYEERLRAFEFVEAEKLFVNLHRSTFFKLLNKGFIEKSGAAVEKKGRLVSIPYLCARCSYSKDLGLSDDDNSKATNTILC